MEDVNGYVSQKAKTGKGSIIKFTLLCTALVGQKHYT